MGLLSNYAKAFRMARKILGSSAYSGIDTLDPFSNLYPNVSRFRSVRDALTASERIGIVARCCSIVGESMASIPYGFYTDDDMEVVDPELIALFKNPNKYMSCFEFKEGIMWYLLLTGNVYIYLHQANALSQRNRKPSEMWLLNPGKMRIVPGKEDLVSGYVYQNGNDQIPFTTDQIVHIKLFNPNNDYYGMGKIQQDPMLFDTMYAAKRFNWNFFEHGAMPGGIFKTDNLLDENSFRRLKASIDANYRGVENQQKLMLLEAGLNYQSTSLSQTDMAFVEQMKMSRDDIASLFGVPPAKLGYVETASLNNAGAQDITFLRETINPYRMRLMDAFDRVVKIWNPTWSFWFEDVTKEALDTKITRATNLLNAGLITRNEAREELGYETIDEPGMNQILVPFNLAPIGMVTEPDVVPAEPAKAPEVAAEPAKTALIDAKKAINRVQLQILRQALRSRKRVEKRMVKTATAYFKAQGEAILARFDAGDRKATGKYDTKALFGPDDDKEIVDSFYNDFMAAISLGAIDAGLTGGIDVDTSLKNPAIKKAIERVSKKITRVNDTTKSTVTDIIDSGLQDGKTITQIRKDIQSAFAEDGVVGGKYRAEMIARTESAAAWDAGATTTYEALGYTTMDVIGCEDEVVVDGQTYGCNSKGIPIEDAPNIEFHPNHTGCFVPGD